jgi:hypothetical protein
MNRTHAIFLICWAVAMLGLGLMNIGFIVVGKVIAYTFGAIAMIVGFYSFCALMKIRFFSSSK